MNFVYDCIINFKLFEMSLSITLRLDSTLNHIPHTPKLNVTVYGNYILSGGD